MRAVEVLDRALGPELVIRTRILQAARQHHARQLSIRDEFTRRIGLAHVEHRAVAVDIARDPTRRRRMRPPVARI